jgi:hypothetical protein
LAKKKKLTYAEKRAKAKAIALGLEEREGVSTEDLEKKNKAQQMAFLYDRFLREYKYDSYPKYVKVLDMKHRAFKSFLRAAEFAEELNLPYDVYMKAQFFYIHKWKGRAPHTYELATFNQGNNSKDRAKMFSEENTPVTKKVTARYTQGKASKESKFKNSEGVLKTFQKAYELSEEAVFKKFVPATAYFDYEWLMSNETYMRLKASGEVE